jgi:hypothetical protein
MHRVRQRLQQITTPRPVPKGTGRLYLKLDLDKVRDLGVKVYPQPAQWRRTHRYGQMGETIPINCIAFALGLHAGRLYIDAMRSDYRLLRTPRAASPDFAEALLDTFHWRRRKKQPRPGDLVVYCDRNKRVRHVGVLLEGGLVRSKWGDLPAIFEHRLWQVPADYGDSVEYYHPMALARVLAEYARLIAP